MKATLSAIALGAMLASACHVVFAGPTATTTQQGTGNTAYTEQRLVDPTSATTATIIQVGNNNHAGDPDAQTPGIHQRNITGFSDAITMIHQHGEENAGSIMQNGTSFPVSAEIRQEGNNNAGVITQKIVTYSDALLRQTGTDNVATIEQSNVADLGIKAIQNGSDNVLSFRQRDSMNGTATVRQTGADNSVTVDQIHLLGSGGTAIEQIGSLNTVTSTLKDDAIDSILQIGTGNTAATNQSRGINSSDIAQRGTNNLATVTQGAGANDSLIRQIGNDNVASVLQSNLANVNNNTADIRQVGNGFVASITQAGGDNHSGIYQH
jgi:hypothetical protein